MCPRAVGMPVPWVEPEFRELETLKGTRKIEELDSVAPRQ